MRTEITLAKAVKIEKGKQYIVIFESDRDERCTDAEDIKKQINTLFKKLGAKVEPVVVIDGRLKIAEVVA